MDSAQGSEQPQLSRLELEMYYSWRDDWKWLHAPRYHKDELKEHRADVLVFPKKLTATLPQSSPLCNLIDELLLKIHKHLDPISRISLALACKRMLNFSTCLPIRFASLTPVNVRFVLLDTIILPDPSNPSQTVSQPTWRICRVCSKIRPASIKYWDDMRSQSLHLRLFLKKNSADTSAAYELAMRVFTYGGLTARGRSLLICPMHFAYMDRLYPGCWKINADQFRALDDEDLADLPGVDEGEQEVDEGPDLEDEGSDDADSSD